MAKHIIHLHHVKMTPQSRSQVGGKAFPLFELASEKIPVPGGFVVTTDAYTSFLDDNHLRSDFVQIVKSKRVVDHALINSLRKNIINATFSKELESEIKDAMQLCRFRQFAVRSSADIEDSSKKSWAGGFDTYLNVPQKAVLHAIKKCWSSLLNSKAIEYAGDISKLVDARMAVLIQESIESEVSGICFTRDPLHREEDDIRIEAIFGLGELLVQGEIIPDRYLVERKSNIILEIIVHEQTRARRALRGGETKLVSLKKGYRQKLSGREIVELARIAQRIEKINGFGRDIEWCKKRDQLYILQSRPITTGIHEKEIH